MNTLSNKYEVVELLRATAALAVAWFHLTNGYDHWVAYSGHFGWLGVEIFFVISGFVVPLALSRTPGRGWSEVSRRFVARRIVRLEPSYMASMLLVIALWYASSMAPNFAGTLPQFSLGQIASHTFYLTQVFGYEWLQPVYWTLAYEFAFYLSMTILFPIIGRRGQGTTFLLLTFASSALVLADHVSPIMMLFVFGVCAGVSPFYDPSGSRVSAA